MTSESGRFVFFGTGACFSMAVLKHLFHSGFLPQAVVVPEYPAASNMPSLAGIASTGANKPNRLTTLAEKASLSIIYAPESNKTLLAEKLAAFKPDFILVACWPYLLAADICTIASKAALNLHPSLLPEYRGPNPVEQQLQAGERSIGVSLHLLTQRFDTGDIVFQEKIDLADGDLSIEIVEQKAAEIGSSMFIEAIQVYGSEHWRPRKQSPKDSG